MVDLRNVHNGISKRSFNECSFCENFVSVTSPRIFKRRNAEVKYMKKRVKRLKDNFYEELDDQDVLPDIEIFKFG